jgi:predicted amino acid racemase
MSSDHLVVDLGDHPVAVGDEIGFGVAYGGLVRAMTSPFVEKIEVAKIEHLGAMNS